MKATVQVHVSPEAFARFRGATVRFFTCGGCGFSVVGIDDAEVRERYETHRCFDGWEFDPARLEKQP